MLVFVLLSAILAALVVLLLVRQYLAKRRAIEQGKNIQDVNVYKDDFDIVTNIVTVLVGVFSILVSIVSVYVMLEQEETQDTLITMKQMEHQPVFNVKITAYPSTEGGPNTYEEYDIKNVGEKMSAPVDVSCRSYIQVSYYDNEHAYVSYYPLEYYFGCTVVTNDLIGELAHSWGGFYSQNLSRFASLYFADHPHLSLKLIHCFSIHYTDLYGIERDAYFENETLTSEESLKEIERKAKFFLGKNKSIKEVTMDDLCEELASKLGDDAAVGKG